VEARNGTIYQKAPPPFFFSVEKAEFKNLFFIKIMTEVFPSAFNTCVEYWLHTFPAFVAVVCRGT